MGNSGSRYETGTGSSSSDESEHPKKRLRSKRKHGHNSEAGGKIARLDTPRYVHEKLFLRGEGSDVEVRAIGCSWKLHKLYLKQCQYFDALFNADSAWKERDASVVNLEFPDASVTIDALHAVLGSLYSNEIALDLSHVEGILCAASFLQLQSVIDSCKELMLRSISDDNVLRLLTNAYKYAMNDVMEETFSFLQVNFWRLVETNQFILDLPMIVLARLLSSPDTLILEGETDVYLTVKKWVFFKNTKNVALEGKALEEAMKQYFPKRSNIFEKYASLWNGVRLHNLMTASSTIDTLFNDKIYPSSILTKALADAYTNHIKNEENKDLMAAITDEAFHLCAQRVGRLITQEKHVWRWSGFHNGIDILITFCHGSISLKRNCLVNPNFSINMDPERVIHYRIVVTDATRAILFDSSKQSISLRPDQAVTVACLADYSLPVSVHLFHLTHNPPQPSFIYAHEYKRALCKELSMLDDLSSTESEDGEPESPAPGTSKCS